MHLKIDTSKQDKIKIGLDDEEFEFSSHEKSSQKLLPSIVKILKSKGTDIHDLKEIAVNTGPGSFTGIRVGVSVAQALGWALGIPVNGKNLSKGDTIDITYE